MKYFYFILFIVLIHNIAVKADNNVTERSDYLLCYQLNNVNDPSLGEIYREKMKRGLDCELILKQGKIEKSSPVEKIDWYRPPFVGQRNYL